MFEHKEMLVECPNCLECNELDELQYDSAVLVTCERCGLDFSAIPFALKTENDGAKEYEL